MLNTTAQMDEYAAHLVKGAISSIENIIPLSLDFHALVAAERVIKLEFGVLIGFTGDVKGKIILIGEPVVFRLIGEAMFGMALEGDMLLSFSGELGNLVVGGMATKMMGQGIKSDITSPAILQGNTVMSGFKNGLFLPVTVENVGEINVYILFD